MADLFPLGPSADERIEADERFMRAALSQARLAAKEGEVPIGAVVVREGEIVAAARNHRERDCDPSAHAEFSAICQAARTLGRWRLSDCTVYVTLEPCVMCAGLMHQARIGRCVFGAADQKAGALGTLYAVHADSRLNHTFDAQGGVLQGECARLLQDFFAAKRAKGGAAAGVVVEDSASAEVGRIAQGESGCSSAASGGASCSASSFAPGGFGVAPAAASAANDAPRPCVAARLASAAKSATASENGAAS